MAGPERAGRHAARRAGRQRGRGEPRSTCGRANIADELAALLALARSDRNAQMAAMHYGWDGGHGVSMQEIAGVFAIEVVGTNSARQVVRGTTLARRSSNR
jgi:hypothetical protein